MHLPRVPHLFLPGTLPISLLWSSLHLRIRRYEMIWEVHVNFNSMLDIESHWDHGLMTNFMWVSDEYWIRGLEQIIGEKWWGAPLRINPHIHLISRGVFIGSLLKGSNRGVVNQSCFRSWILQRTIDPTGWNWKKMSVSADVEPLRVWSQEGLDVDRWFHIVFLGWFHGLMRDIVEQKRETTTTTTTNNDNRDNDNNQTVPQLCLQSLSQWSRMLRHGDAQVRLPGTDDFNEAYDKEPS